MKKIITIIVIIFTISTCTVVVKNAVMPTFLFLGYMYLLINPQVENNGEYREQVLKYYEENKNIILPKEDIDVKYYELYGALMEPRYVIKFNTKNRFNSKSIKEEEYDETTETIPDDIHLVGEKEYIVNNLIYDKSKGNHFEKIEEYIEKHKEEIFKGMLGETWENGTKIRFYTLILHKLDDNKYILRKNIYEVKDNILKRAKNENFDFDSFYKERDLKEKEFFKTKIKYENIDWCKYIEYMGDYPVLIMEIEYKVLHSEEEKKISKEDYHIYSTDFDILNNSSKLSKIGIRRINTRQKIYKDIEKFYNKDTFTFVIRDLSDPE